MNTFDNKKLPLIALLLLGMLWPGITSAQRRQCRDMVHLLGGTVLTGKIIAYQPGDTLTLETWSGITMKVADNMVHHIVQRCPKGFAGSEEKMQRLNTFKERGWYHFTRASVLGSTDDIDFGLQHSSGYKFNRFINVGVGVGMDKMSYLRSQTVTTYPVFAEIRGFLTPNRLSPFYAIGGGYAFTGAVPESADNINRWWTTSENWEGGWMAQGHIGYRCGNHFMVYGGLRLQRKSMHWEGREIYGTDRFLHKRFELGLGILL
jgi:hypothetical protein